MFWLTINLFLIFLATTLNFLNADLPKEASVDSSDFSVHVENSVRQYSPIKCLMLNIGSSELLNKVSHLVKFDIEFTDQLEIELNKTENEIGTNVLAKQFEKGFSLCLYLKEKKPHLIQVTLKTTTDSESDKPIFDKTFDITDEKIIRQSHQISDELIPRLTNEKSPALSTLAYCKQISHKSKVVCVADYACKKEKVVVGTRTINVAPCWHSQAPVLYFSQLMKNKGKLMSVDLNTKEQKNVCAYDGLNMQPSFSQDGSQAILCLSGGGNSELYLYDQRLCERLGRRAFKQITTNGGNNVCPCMLENGDLVFCSDFETPWPQIYYHCTKSKTNTRLTNGKGYCAAPSYNSQNRSVAYSRIVNGTFQIFKISLNDPKRLEQQVTFSSGNKHEPAWSPCGNYLAFTFDTKTGRKGKMIPQIAIMSCKSGKVHVLTDSNEPKSFPAWTSMTLY